MNIVKEERVSFQTLKDLNSILSADGPCLTAYVPLGTKSLLHWRESLKSIEGRVHQFGPAGRELFNSLPEWDAIFPEGDQTEAKSIAIFRSKDVSKSALLDFQVADRIVLGPHFYIRPLLPSLVRDRSFYVLALSQKNTRLLHCTMHTSEEIPLPSETKTNFDTWMNQAQPDHTAVNNAMSTGSQGAIGPNALAPKGADREKKDEYLAHYFKQIDHGVNEILRGKTEPVVLCGVEYEIPIYRRVNNYRHLASEEVLGSAEGLKSGEMHSRAIQALERSYFSRLDETLAEWNHRVGAGASNRLKDVVTAAHDGRVLTLIVSDSFEQTGVFDEATNTVKGRVTGTPEDEDLINDAAVQTICHAGDVLVAPQNKMPNGSPLAAIFRY
jgi:hypothetical protein